MGTSGLPDYTPEVRGPQAQELRVYISGEPRVCEQVCEQSIEY